MMRRRLISGIFVVLLISLGLIDGCTEAVPAFTSPTTPTVVQSSILPSNTVQPSATPVVIADVPAINIQDASYLIQNNKVNPDFIIIDVRTADEFKSGHLANAFNIDYYPPDFKSNIDKLERGKEYLIYCRTGIRGLAATRIMIDLGFIKIHNLSGGIVEWINAGYPTMK